MFLDVIILSVTVLRDRARLFQWCSGAGVTAVLEVLDTVVQQKEFKWGAVLPLLSVLITTCDEASDSLRS